MQRHKTLSARILSLALSAAMVTTILPATVFADEVGNVAPGISPVGTIQSFDKLQDRFTPSVGENAPNHVYALSVALNTLFADLNLPAQLTAMVTRTTVAAPVAGKPDEPVAEEATLAEDKSGHSVAMPDSDKAADTDAAASGIQPTSPADAVEEAKQEVKDEALPPAPEPVQPEEAVVTTVQQETVPVTWQSDKEYKPDENGKFIYTAVLPEGYILADGVKLPQIYVMVGRQARASGQAHDIGTGNLTLTTGDGCSASAPHVVTGTTTQYGITAESGEHWVTLSGVSIDMSGTGNGSVKGLSSFELKGTAKVNLILEASTSNTLKGGGCSAALEVVDGTSLVIDGTGALTANGGLFGAGIGSAYAEYAVNATTGSITINGGNITATGGYTGVGGNDGAGIGGGSGSSGGTITINGGTVTASSYGTSAGIGNGDNTGYTNITITDGIVNATGAAGAGIGGGVGSNTADVEISGGTVTATSTGGGVGIGSGNESTTGGTIKITGGTIVATGKGWGATGIGRCTNVFGPTAIDTISITGGTVTAGTEGQYGCGIGSYDITTQAPNGNVKISNAAKVTAYSVTPGNAIGDLDGVITPDGGTAASIMQFDFALSTPASTTIEVKNSSGTSLSPALSYTPGVAFQSLALTAPATGSYTAYQGSDKLKHTKDSTTMDAFAVVAGLNKYTDVLGPDRTIAKAFTIGTLKPLSARSISTNAGSAPTGTTAADIVWTDASGNTAANGTLFAEKTVYSSTHVFTANAGYAFDSTLAAADITVTYIDTGTKTATLSADKKTLTVVVTWPETLELPAYTGTQAPPPSATPATKGENSIKLTAVKVTGEGIQYAKSTSNTAPTSDADWQGSTTFDNLTKGTTYYFFARVKANTAHKAGAASTGTAITTDGVAAPTIIVVGGPDATEGYESADRENLQKAIAAIAAGGTIQLGANIDVGSISVTFGENVCTLDLNGKTLSNADSNVELIEISGTASLIVTDSSVTRNGMISGALNDTILHRSTGDLKILAGTISCHADFYTAIRSTQNGTITIENGTVTNSSMYYGAIVSNGKITMRGGTVTSVCAYNGTIQIDSVPTPAAILVDIQDGTVSNTGTMEFEGAVNNSVIFPDPVTPDNLSSYYRHIYGSVGTVVPTALVDYTGIQAAAPSSTPVSKTNTAITLAAVAVNGEIIEYAKSTTSTAPSADADWQTSATFTGLTEDTQYYFFARVKAKATHKTGIASAGTPIKTDNNDAKKLAAAKILVQTALANMTVTNATTQADVFKVINDALAGSGVTAAWNTPDDFRKTEAANGAAGSITGTIKLTYGSASDTVSVSRTIAPTAPTAPLQHTILATAGSGGSLSTGQVVLVNDGDSAGFGIIPNKGYRIADVMVNGKSVGAVNYYIFTGVRANQTIHATFVRGEHINPQTSVAVAP